MQLMSWLCLRILTEDLDRASDANSHAREIRRLNFNYPPISLHNVNVLVIGQLSSEALTVEQSSVMIKQGYCNQRPQNMKSFQHKDSCRT